MHVVLRLFWPYNSIRNNDSIIEYPSQTHLNINKTNCLRSSDQGEIVFSNIFLSNSSPTRHTQKNLSTRDKFSSLHQADCYTEYNNEVTLNIIKMLY